MGEQIGTIQVRERSCRSADGSRLYLRTDIPQACSGICVFAHGLCEHQGRYDAVANVLANAGIGVYRFDFRGHGRSEGERIFCGSWREMLSDISAVVETARAEYPDVPLFLTGHSMGGLFSAAYGVEHGDLLAGIVLLGALTMDSKKGIRSVCGGRDMHLAIKNHLMSYLCKNEETIRQYQSDPLVSNFYTFGICYAMRACLDWLREQTPRYHVPTLLLHGAGDQLVSLEDSLQFFRTIPVFDKQLTLYGRMGHDLLHEQEAGDALHDMVHWFSGHVQNAVAESENT